MFKSTSAQVVAGLVVFFAVSHLPILAQSTPCPPQSALIAPDNPAYADAMDLAKHLEDHGFVIQCIYPTKLGSMFQVVDGDVVRSTVKGEANFTTNYGAFDVIFMPKPQTFADFKITERRKGGGYLYRFTGTPKVLAGDKFSFGTARRNYFLKRENWLFFLGDQALLSRLEQALGSPAAP